MAKITGYPRSFSAKAHEGMLAAATIADGTVLDLYGFGDLLAETETEVTAQAVAAFRADQDIAHLAGMSGLFQWDTEPQPKPQPATVAVPANVGPKAGTMLRAWFDLLVRPQGCTQAETTALYGYASGCEGSAKALAAKYGLHYRKVREGKVTTHYLEMPS